MFIRLATVVYRSSVLLDPWGVISIARELLQAIVKYRMYSADQLNEPRIIANF